jgi:hypothetical protein
MERIKRRATVMTQTSTKLPTMRTAITTIRTLMRLITTAAQLWQKRNPIAIATLLTVPNLFFHHASERIKPQRRESMAESTASSATVTAV